MEQKYMVAPRKSISFAGGILNEYSEISVKKLGSIAIFNALIKSGSIVEAKPKPATKFSVNLRPEVHKPKGVLPAPASAALKKIEIIDSPKVLNVGDPKMPEIKKKMERIKKNLFGDEAEEIPEPIIPEEKEKKEEDEF